MVVALLWLACKFNTRAALLAYEPFTNAVRFNIIGSADGFGFNGAWQTNSSSGEQSAVRGTTGCD